ncbi:MAG: tetratricopeptide repeat protein [Nitrospinota bacterium]|nr:tetratricopeptide repeat protein [Nitrospinota bacterium]
MMYRYVFQSILWPALLGLVILVASPPAVESREATTQVENYRLGSHPQSTRIIIQLNQDTPYRVLTNYAAQKVVIWIRHAQLNPKVQSNAFKDRHLSQVQAAQIQDNVKLTLRLAHPDIQLVHYVKHRPEQIVIDLKPKGSSVREAALKQNLQKGDLKQSASKPVARKTSTTNDKARLSPQKTDRLPLTDPEEKLKSGQKEYEKALKLFQNKNYGEALTALRLFQQKYRESRFLANAAYMIAESEYNLTKQDQYPNYEKALTAYQYAMRTYPDSQFYDHALFKAASIYEDLNYTLEARTLYEKGIHEDKASRYNAARETGMGLMLIEEDQLNEAYKTFQILLRKFPQNPEAKQGLFKIAQRYYEARDFPKALKIYEDVVKRWPDELKEQPEVNFYIGEIYFNRKQYAQARQYYFNLVNLAPESPNAHRGLNRIGDTYLQDKNGLAALTVFNKSYSIDPDSEASQYAQIRLADVGIRFPGLPVKDLIFDVSPYYQPYRTFKEVTAHPVSRDNLAEATFSRGSAYYREQRYLEAIEEFKRLLPFEADSKFHLWAKNYLQLSMVQLIDQYAKQEGYLPVLYAYADYLNLGIGELNRVQTQLQIGESYKAIGLNSEALKFFEKVKFADVNGAYTDRLFLDLGEIHLNENQFKDAERVARTFINAYGNSPRLPEAKIILARAHQGQKQFDRSIEIYNELLESPNTDIPRIHYLMAETWFAREDLRNAARAYRKTLDSYDRTIHNPPDYVQTAYYKLGMTLYMQGQTAPSLDALMAGRKLFPDHRLRNWADYLIIDNLDRLQKKEQAESELKTLVAESRDDLLQKAAQSHLKVIDWEKRLKELL